MDPSMPQPCRSPAARDQRGAVAVVVALSALVLFGFAGIAIDVGRLYVNRSELQTAADACALAAAAELTCDPAAGACPAAFLLNAQASGIYAANRNTRDFQVNPVVIAPADVTFNTALAPNANYLSIAAGASTNSRYVMCTARATGIAPWFMGVLGAGGQTVATTGVATRAPGQTSCPNVPIGVCSKPGGYAVGEWITADYKSSGSQDDFDGGFKLAKFSTADLRDHFIGAVTVCGVSVNDLVTTPGGHNGLRNAYNTRFGVYKSYSIAEAPPDRTGWAYPSTTINLNQSAYSDYRAHQAVNDPFDDQAYTDGKKIQGTVATRTELQQNGTDRRMVTAPIIDCSKNPAPISAMACLLMLNPMSVGNADGKAYLEYRGLTTALNSPCRTSGIAGGPASLGAQVPTLVQ